MGDDIEKYLVAKLNEAIDEVQGSEQHLPAKVWGLSAKFKQLKSSLGAPNPTTKLSREDLYKLSNLLSEWQMHSKKNTNFVEAFSFAQNLDTIIANLQGDGSHGIPSNGEGTSDLPSNPGEDMQGYRWSDRSVDENKVHGIHDKALSLQKLLVPRNNNDDDCRFNMIGIVGMRGVGKTTLTQLVFNKPEVKKHFLPRIWVCASKQPEDDSDNRNEIVIRMLMSLGVEKTIIDSAKQKHGLKGLLFTLRQELKGKRYLIVLDDVWSLKEKYKEFCTFCSSLEKDENKCSEKLAYGLPKEYGGAVFVTSRIEELVVEMVGEENLHRVLPLEDPESCWKIFTDSAEPNHKQLEGLKGKIIEKCAGLPLTARMMGEIAREPHPQIPAVPENQSQ